MRLAVSFAGKKTHFLDLRIKSYGCLKFQGDVWAGRACAGANQQELTTCSKSGGQEEKKFQEKWEQPDRRRCRQQSPAGRGSTPVLVRLFQIFYFLFYLKKKNFWKFGKWARAFERMDVQHPHYLKLAPTLGSANSSKIHGEWRFYFFPQFLFAKFSPHLDLHIYHWDFCFIKDLIP
jgi:hypothetical protein